MKSVAYKLLVLMLMVLMMPTAIAVADDQPTLDEILIGAADRLEETESMAFVFQMEGTTFVDEAKTIQLLGAEGVMQRPDRVDVTFTAIVLGRQQISIRMINLGDESWITDIVTGKWVPSPSGFGYNPAVLYDETDGLGPVMSRMTEPELDGSEKIENRDAWHIVANVDGEVTAAMTSDTLRGTHQGLELWIAKDNYDLLQIEVIEPTDEDLEDPATWVLTLSKHNKDVEIERPD